MIHSKTISLNPKTRLKEHYKKLGYDVDKDLIDVKIEHLSKNSHIKIKVICDICGKEKNLPYVKYIKNISNCDYYSCCTKCAKEKVKQTNLKRYGVECAQKSNIIKEKTIQTNLERYGVEYSQKLDKIKEKVKQTNLKRYGEENCLLLEMSRNNLKKKFKENKKEIQAKTKQTNLKKYGIEHPQKLEHIKVKVKKTNLEKYGTLNGLNKTKYYNKILQNIKDKYPDLNIIDFKNKLIEIKCDICEKIYKIHTQLLIERYKRKHTNICTKCNTLYSTNISNSELELLGFIKSNYNGEIITSDRKILNGKELDIYLPDLNLAFEFNGLYWHNELNKDKNYHKMKTDLCKEKGIHLIHIWEDDWNFKQIFIKSIILDNLKLNKNISDKIEIKEIKDVKLVRNFLEQNHIQGFVNSTIKIGLFNNNELICLMILKKKGYNYIIKRICNKLFSNFNTQHILFNYFIDNYDYNSIKVIIDNSFERNNLYLDLGFKFIKTKLNYQFINNGIREQKSTKLINSKIYGAGYSQYQFIK